MVTNILSVAATNLRNAEQAAKRLEAAHAEERELSNHRIEFECTFFCRSCINTFTRWLRVIPNRARCKCGSERVALIAVDKVPY